MRMRVRGPKFTTVSMDKVFDRLHKMAERNEDVTISGKDISFNPNGTVEIKGVGRQSFTDYSFSQLCTKLKLPVEFMRRSPSGDGYASRKRILDHWKESTMDDKQWLIRMKRHTEKDEESGSSGRVRAVLSDKYSIFDNLDFLKLLKPVADENQMVIQLGNVTEESFHLRCLYSDQVRIGPKEKEDFHNVGIHFGNSEVGSRNVTGELMIFRQICTNGMIARVGGAMLFSQRHLHLERHEMKGMVLAGVDQSQEQKNELFDRLGAVQKVVVRDPDVELRSVLAGQPVKVLEAATEAYQEEPMASRYGIVQAITRAARNLPIDQRVDLEAVAGAYLLAA